MPHSPLPLGSSPGALPEHPSPSQPPCRFVTAAAVYRRAGAPVGPWRALPRTLRHPVQVYQTYLDALFDIANARVDAGQQRRPPRVLRSYDEFYDHAEPGAASSSGSAAPPAAQSAGRSQTPPPAPTQTPPP